MLWCFVSGSCWSHHVSSPVMTLSIIFALSKNQRKCEADVVSGHLSNWRHHVRFEVLIRATRRHLPEDDNHLGGTIFAEIFLVPKSSVIICRTVSYSYLIHLLLVSHRIFDLSAPRFVLYPHLHLSFACSAAHILGHLAHFLTLPWTAYGIKKHSISSQRTHNTPMLIGLTFH
jgi:hypothetical protein